MSNAQFGDAARDRLRVMVETMEHEMTQATPAQPLQQAWSAIVKALDLGPMPAYRVCPSCHATGMAGASRCGTCWAALPVEKA
ncbi:MAG: hypothetical protein WKG01_03515 [Kofleriaceae bacterium]